MPSFLFRRSELPPDVSEKQFCGRRKKLMLFQAGRSVSFFADRRAQKSGEIRRLQLPAPGFGAMRLPVIHGLNEQY